MAGRFASKGFIAGCGRATALALLALALATPGRLLALQHLAQSGAGKKASLPPKPPETPRPKPPAERVADVLLEFIARANERSAGKTPLEKTVRLSEGDLNAYLQQAVQRKPRFGLTSVYIKLISPGYVGTTATIDFDQVQVDDSSLAVRMVRSVLSGRQQIYLEGSVSGKDGLGQFKLEKAYFGSIRLPVYFIEKVISFLGQRQNPPVDPEKPIPLPFGIRKVDVAAGSVELRG